MMRKQFGRFSSLEYVAMAGVLALCGQVAFNRLSAPSSAQSKLEDEVKAMQIANDRKNRLEIHYIELMVIRASNPAGQHSDADCAMLKTSNKLIDKLESEFQAANAKYYGHQPPTQELQARVSADTEKIASTANHARRMTESGLALCRS